MADENFSGNFETNPTATGLEFYLTFKASTLAELAVMLAKDLALIKQILENQNKENGKAE